MKLNIMKLNIITMIKRSEKIEGHQNEIIQLYKEGKPATEIANIYNVSVVPIYSILREMNMNIRNSSDSHKKYTIDEKYFDCINNRNKAYLLGFLFADGYNNTDKNTVQIILSNKDCEILELFKKELKTNRPIKEFSRDKHDYVSLYIHNKKISEALSRIGCVKNKTHKLDFPNIKEEFYNSFILGYFDGDGCVNIQEKLKLKNTNNIAAPKGNVSIVSNIKFIKKLEYIFNSIGINTYINKRHKKRNNAIYNINIQGNLKILKFKKWLYNGNKIFLKRKKEKFDMLEDLYKSNCSKCGNYFIMSKLNTELCDKCKANQNCL